jgi:hypothetical protein
MFASLASEATFEKTEDMRVQQGQGKHHCKASLDRKDINIIMKPHLANNQPSSSTVLIAFCSGKVSCGAGIGAGTSSRLAGSM